MEAGKGPALQLCSLQMVALQGIPVALQRILVALWGPLGTGKGREGPHNPKWRAGLELGAGSRGCQEADPKVLGWEAGEGETTQEALGRAG